MCLSSGWKAQLAAPIDKLLSRQQGYLTLQMLNSVRNTKRIPLSISASKPAQKNKIKIPLLPRKIAQNESQPTAVTVILFR